MSNNIVLHPVLQQVLADQERELQMLPTHAELKSGGGGGTSGGMEERIVRLEAHMEHVRGNLDKLGGVPERLRALEVRVDHLPTKGFIVTASATTIALLTSVVVFADKLRALIS